MPVNTATFSISGVGAGTLNDSGSVNDNQNVFGGAANIFNNGGSGPLITIADNQIGSTALAVTPHDVNRSFWPASVKPGTLTNLPTSYGSLTVIAETNVVGRTGTLP